MNRMRERTVVRVYIVLWNVPRASVSVTIYWLRRVRAIRSENREFDFDFRRCVLYACISYGLVSIFFFRIVRRRYHPMVNVVATN